MTTKQKQQLNVQQLIGIILLSLVVYSLSTFPVFQIIILALITIIVCLQCVNKYTWLVMLPFVIVAVDFTPFSGRFIFNEFDFAVLSMLSAGLLTKQFKMRVVVNKQILIPLMLVLLALLSMNLKELSDGLNTFSTTNPYYSSMYHFKVAKGLFYGFFLALLLASQYRNNAEATFKHLILGGWLASFALFSIILWERHTLDELLSLESWWAVVSSFLDLSSSYRVTGLISDMHTGGEALDGIFLLLIPINLLGFFWFSSDRMRIISLLALCMACYCVLVGFTRTTYLSMAVSIISFLILHRKFFGSTSNMSPSKLLLYLVITGTSYGMYVSAGYSGLASFFILVTSSHVIKYIQNIKHWNHITFFMAFLVMFLASAYLAITGHFESKWIEKSTASLSLLIISLITSAVAIFYLIKDEKVTKVSNLLIQASSLMAIAFILVAVLGGTQINTRMTTAFKDVGTRLNHWNRVLDASSNTLTSSLIGNGLGSFPLNFLLAHPETVKKVGSFSVRNEALSLGGGRDLAFGQRVDINPFTDYQFNFELSSNSDGRLFIFMCERNLIFATNYSPNCVAKKISLKATSEPKVYSLTLNSKKVGQKDNSLSRWPTMIYIKYNGNEKIYLHHIEMLDENRTFNSLANADFSKGLDRWFFYNDFQHLPWHIKSVYLSAYYQLGLIGIVLLVLLLRPLVGFKQDDIIQNAFQIFIVSYITGILTFGFFGDPLDSARASVPLFTLLIAFLLVKASRES